MPIKILVVDDEPDLALLVRQRFRRQIADGKYVFVFAHDGADALEKFSNDPDIELVLTDINMPVMDGLTLLSKLLEVDPLLQPVIVSAYGDMDNIRTAMNRGACDFLTKPIDFQDLEITVDKAIQVGKILKESAKNRERLAALQRELAIAHSIQQSILPRDRESGALPKHKGVELFATMLPARDVGGDFYDYFLVDDDRLAIVIGDVSGKGVPAAIFMAICRTMLKAVAALGSPPGECLREVNAHLYPENQAGMFVTVFYAILNLRTGELLYSNAGHLPPHLISGRGVTKVLESGPGGLMLGVLEGQSYETEQTILLPSETLLLYTDGVTEAMDRFGNQFSEQRLEEFLRQADGLSAEALVQGCVDTVRKFAAGAAQSDDITVLAARYVGGP